MEVANAVGGKASVNFDSRYLQFIPVSNISGTWHGSTMRFCRGNNNRLYHNSNSAALRKIDLNQTPPQEIEIFSTTNTIIGIHPEIDAVFENGGYSNSIITSYSLTGAKIASKDMAGVLSYWYANFTPADSGCIFYFAQSIAFITRNLNVIWSYNPLVNSAGTAVGVSYAYFENGTVYLIVVDGDTRWVYEITASNGVIKKRSLLSSDVSNQLWSRNVAGYYASCGNNYTGTINFYNANLQRVSSAPNTQYSGISAYGNAFLLCGGGQNRDAVLDRFEISGTKTSSLINSIGLAQTHETGLSGLIDDLCGNVYYHYASDFLHLVSDWTIDNYKPYLNSGGSV